MSFRFPPCRGAALLALSLGFAAPLAAQDVDALSDNLVRLRGEVEQLNNELTLVREEQRTALSGLAAQKAELAAGVERQQLAARELRDKLAAQREQAASVGIAGESLLPILHAALAGLVQHVRTGLPFKREERLAELETFGTQLGNGSLPPQRAVNRLWAFFEDEFRLTRDNSLHSQTIELAGERVLAEVAKVGTVALYFRTREGVAGQAVAEGGAWRFAAFEDPADSARVEALFESLRRQIRQGFFELPVASVATATGAPR